LCLNPHTHIRKPRIQTLTQGKGYRLIIEGRGSKRVFRNVMGEAQLKEKGRGSKRVFRNVMGEAQLKEKGRIHAR
jgi:hypothetical protein